MSKLIILSNNIDYSETKKKIILQTSLGNDIDNYQVPELSSFEINYQAEFPKKYPLLRFKGQSTAMYNCHGFAFGSRRTNIDGFEIRKILKEDCYIPVKMEDAEVGDMILYVSNDKRADIEHTGIIVEIDTSTPQRLIWVFGKWGKYKEVRHPIWMCDYSECVLEFWRNNHGYVEAK